MYMDIKPVLCLPLLVSFVLFFGCTDTKKETPSVAPAVVVEKVIKSTISESEEFVGKTSAVSTVALRARVTGFLEETKFEHGQMVKPDDVLFVIEQAPYQVEVDKAKANLAAAKADLDLAKVQLMRMEELKKKQTVSQSDLDKAVADEKAADAQVQARNAELSRAKLNLEYTTIEASIAGQIDRPKYDNGNLIGPESGVLATVNQLDPVYVNFSLSETALVGYKKHLLERNLTTQDQAASNEKFFVPTIKLPDDSDYPHTGVIDFMDNKVDPATGTIAIRAKFPNPEKLLLPGQFVRIIIKRKQDIEGLLVPQVAIITRKDNHQVLVVDQNNTVALRDVKLGNKYGSKWIVESGLSEGEWIVTQGLQKVQPGMTVDPRRTENNANQSLKTKNQPPEQNQSGDL